VGGGREWNRRIAERIRKVKMVGGFMYEWQVTWGEEGTIDARVSISFSPRSRVSCDVGFRLRQGVCFSV
jgi:hypothetical protein